MTLPDSQTSAGATAAGATAAGATAAGASAAGAAPRTGGDSTGSSTADDSRSLGEIVGDIATDLTSLFKQELNLAKTEVKNEATRAGKGAGMLGGAAVAGLLTLIPLTFTCIWLLDNWMPIELAALILTVVWGLVAAVLALQGKKELQKISPPLETTQQSLKEDVQWAKAQKNNS